MLTWFKKLYDDTIFGPVPIDRETDRTLFMEGHAGAIGEGPWQRGIWRDRSGQGEKFDAFWMLDTYPTRNGAPGEEPHVVEQRGHHEGGRRRSGKDRRSCGGRSGGRSRVRPPQRRNPLGTSIQNLPEVQNDPYRKVFVAAIQAGGGLRLSVRHDYQRVQHALCEGVPRHHAEQRSDPEDPGRCCRADGQHRGLQRKRVKRREGRASALSSSAAALK